MLSVLESLVRSVARQTRANGVLCLTASGHPALVAAFAELGWSDPYPLDAIAKAVPFEAATVKVAERAVLDRPKGRLG